MNSEGRPIVMLVGAHWGQEIAKCLKDYGATVYAIEPVPSNAAKIEEEYADNSRVILIKKAAWVEDAKRRMNLYDASVSHSLIGKNKPARKVIEVDGFDFSKFISNFAPGQIVYMRMDIEGAEYAVLAKCFMDGTMDRIQELNIELHMPPKVNVPTKLRESTTKLLEEWNRSGKGKMVRAT